jgi:6-phosphogluconolactonase (cycloisomerase 2 family)
MAGGSPATAPWAIWALRILPILSSILVLAAIGGSCGRSIFPKVTANPAATSTPTPGVGAFVYLTNFNDAKVSKFSRNRTTGALGTPATVKTGAIQGPIGLAVGLSGNALYVANAADNEVHEFGINSTSGALSPIGSGVIAAGTAPRQVAITPSGSFAYAGNFLGGSISEYSANTATGALAANGVVTNGVTQPYGAIATDSFLYVSDTSLGAMLSYAINSDGTLAVPPGSIASVSVGTGTPGPMAIDPTRQFVFVSDITQGVVSVFRASGGALTFVSSVATSAPGTPAMGLAYVTTPSSNNFVYVANQTAVPNSVSIFSFNSTLGTLTLIGAGTTGSKPTAVVAEPSGSFLYVTNQGDATVTQFTINPTSGALTSPVTVNTENPANSSSGPLFIAIAH